MLSRDEVVLTSDNQAQDHFFASRKNRRVGSPHVRSQLCISHVSSPHLTQIEGFSSWRRIKFMIHSQDATYSMVSSRLLLPTGSASVPYIANQTFF